MIKAGLAWTTKALLLAVLMNSAMHLAIASHKPE